MLSILKNKPKNYIPDNVRKFFGVNQADPDEKPGRNNIVKVCCTNAVGELLAKGRFESPTRHFRVNMPIQHSGVCAYARTALYWAEDDVWFYATYEAPGFDWLISNPIFVQGDDIRLLINITGATT